MKHLLLILIAVTLWSIHSLSQSESNQSESSEFSRSTWQYRDHTGWTPYISADLGYASNMSDPNAEGVPSSLKILGSYELQNTAGVFDIGYGVQNQSFVQSTALDSSIATEVLELASRYQFANRLQLGAVYNQFFNVGQNFGANQGDAEFGGIQLLKEFDFSKDYSGRFGGKIMTSLNINNQTSNMFVVDFQIGWGGSGSMSSAGN